MFLICMIQLSSSLVYSRINITQINFHQFFQRNLQNMFKHTTTQQEMAKITVSDCAIRNCGPSLNKTVKHCRVTLAYYITLKLKTADCKSVSADHLDSHLSLLDLLRCKMYI